VYTIGDLPIENRLETVDHDAALEEALRRMFDYGYTQVGVERDGKLVGVVTYRSVVRTLLALHQLDVDDRSLDRISVGAAVEEAHVANEDADVLTLFDELAEHTYVVVEREGEWRILTDFDLLLRLGETIEPFLLIEAIEMSIRDLFRQVFGDDLSTRLAETFDEDHPLPTPASVEHCSFGHYAQFISINWAEFEPEFEDQPDVIRELVLEIGDVRNQLFHFRVDELASFNRGLLRFGHSYFSAV
jgi:CBS domain-containing protein